MEKAKSMLDKIRTHFKNSKHFDCYSHIKSDGTGAVILTSPWVMYGFFVGQFFGRPQLSVTTVTRMQRDPKNSARKNITIRCADIGLEIKGTKIVEAMRTVDKMFDERLMDQEPFDFADMREVEIALASISKDVFILPEVENSTTDHLYMIEGGESVISLTYKRRHLPILYTHLPDYRSILRKNAFHKMIDMLDIRFFGYENNTAYKDALFAIEALHVNKQLNFCQASGCEPEGDRVSVRATSITTGASRVHNRQLSPVDTRDDSFLYDNEPMESNLL